MPTGEQRSLTAAQLEVAVLERDRPRRTFRRLGGSTLAELLGQPADGAGPTSGAAPDERETPPPTSLAGGSHEPPGPAPDGGSDTSS
jgi:proteasome alpha subunit